MNSTKQDKQRGDGESSSSTSSKSYENSDDEPPESKLKTEVDEGSQSNTVLEGEWQDVTGKCSDFTDKLKKAPSSGVESTHWSVVLEGEWQDVTGKCSDFTDKLKKAHPSESKSEDERLQEWTEWYPRKEDNEEELVQKTATQAKFEPDKSPAKYLEKSRSHLNSSLKIIFNQDQASSLLKLGKSFKSGIVAFTSFLGLSLGKIEEFLYENVILRTNPFYFDNSLISASFKKTNRFEVSKNDKYRLKIKIHEEETKDNF